VGHIRILSYNVHGGVGMDRRHLPARQLAILRRSDADCVALQEFVNSPDPNGEQLLDHWAESLGMTGRFAPAFERGGQTFGNAILSRFPIGHCAEHDISVPRGRRRVALEVSLAVDRAMLSVITVHCAVNPAARTMQRSLVSALASAASGDVRILLGDFNEWHVWNGTFRALRAQFGVGPTMPTFPAVAPALALDRIWVCPPERLIATHVDSRLPAPYASDHLPIIATVEV
jgi:endonuclease/exonuclease/phosphatase family metal-dependent hydrolase